MTNQIPDWDRTIEKKTLLEQMFFSFLFGCNFARVDFFNAKSSTQKKNARNRNRDLQKNKKLNPKEPLLFFGGYKLLL